MGQANNRGSFEDRKSKSIIANQERHEAYERHEALLEMNRTPEEHESRKKSRRKLATFMAIAAGSLII